MKSILAKQAPHRGPWLQMRVRQAMQTGGKSTSARRPSIDRKGLTLVASAARAASGPSKLSSASLIAMGVMIKPRGPRLEEPRPAIP
jgi:hypothetical protein